MLELDLEQASHLDREAGGAGDADARVLVGLEDLLDVALRNDVAHRGAAVAGHDHTAVERGGHDRGAVRDAGELTGGGAGRTGQHLGRLRGQEVGERGASHGPVAVGKHHGAAHWPPFWTKLRTNS